MWNKRRACLTCGCATAAAALGLFAGTGPAAEHPSNSRPNGDGDCVVLLHGLGRSAWSLKRVEWALEKRGYRVINRSYPSRRLTVEGVASKWLPELLAEEEVAGAPRVHFVTHSLGGIILREYLEKNRLPNLGRVVMLAPPNRGSELVDTLSKIPGFTRLVGKPAPELGTGQKGIAQKLGPAAFELGIIAGDRSWNPVFSACVPGQDDGKVSVQSTRLEGMKEHLVVHRTHTYMMWRKDVLAAVAGFLERGTFVNQQSPEDASPADSGADR